MELAEIVKKFDNRPKQKSSSTVTSSRQQTSSTSPQKSNENKFACNTATKLSDCLHVMHRQDVLGQIPITSLATTKQPELKPSQDRNDRYDRLNLMTSLSVWQKQIVKPISNSPRTHCHHNIEQLFYYYYYYSLDYNGNMRNISKINEKYKPSFIKLI